MNSSNPSNSHSEGTSQSENSPNTEYYEDDYEEDLEELQSATLKTYLESLNINVPASSCTLDFEKNEISEMGTRYPTKDSKFSMISENQTTDNFIENFDIFYNEMIGRVRSLKSTPALRNQKFPNTSNIDEDKLFRNLKDTPEVKKKLGAIKKMDQEIKNIIGLYNTERSERLETQLEMCNEIHRNNTLPERETQMFLDLCDFEFSENGDCLEDDEKGGEKLEKTDFKSRNNFIKKNIELAKEGILANCSLTDEEKMKLEGILSGKEDGADIVESHKYSQGNEEMRSNAFFFTDNAQKRMNDLDSELEKFSIDERGNEKKIDTHDSFENLSDCLLKLSLDKVDSKLKELRAEEVDKPKTNGPNFLSDDDPIVMVD
ncbi:hypothetical protein JTB14_000642 [Gonioctena quinquepunctata]|nr:hypothetical protein JTB14_000642 [Gonioctena quinquepunctata]